MIVCLFASRERLKNSAKQIRDSHSEMIEGNEMSWFEMKEEAE